jgi:WD40 repeat protein
VRTDSAPPPRRPASLPARTNLAWTRSRAAAVTHERLCFVNQSPDEVIRSLFYNKLNESLVTVSVFREDNFSSLKCRSTRLEYMRRAKPDGGYPLFESESLCWPGFVEFDDVNGKVLTYSAQDKAYKIWDLHNYRPLYTIEDADIHEIKISPGIMLVIYHKKPDQNSIPLFIRSIETGEILKKFSHILKVKKIDFIEQFNEKLLIKQEHEDLQIIDVRSGDVIRVPEQRFQTPSAFIFLYENQLFLTFRENTVTVWNLSGDKITSFEDHELWHPDCNTNNIYITAKQDIIVSFCRDKSTTEHGLSSIKGAVNISSIFTGKCVAKIAAADSEEPRHAKALERVSAVFYNEEHNEIYTGNEKGHLAIWSPERCGAEILEEVRLPVRGGGSSSSSARRMMAAAPGGQRATAAASAAVI